MSATVAVELDRVNTLLLDADGSLFASEEPAFVASAEVVNRLMQRLGCEQRFSSDELRRSSTGKNFRTLAAELSRDCGQPLPGEALDAWVEEERVQVTRHLAEVLKPEGEVRDALETLAGRYQLAVVSSSALARLAVCFTAAQLDDLLPTPRRFSAEDSLSRPTSKPDPAVYLTAAAQLGVGRGCAIAIEDSTAGVASAVAAGLPVVGNVCFVPAAERAWRAEELRGEGAFAICCSWAAITRLLMAPRSPGHG